MQNRLKWVYRIVPIGCILFASAACVWARSEAGEQWQGDPATIAAVEILVHDPSEDVPDWSVMAQALLGLRPGDTLNADGLEEAVRNLAPLAQVQTGAIMGPEGVHLTFQVTPYRLIKTIDISGNYPLLEREVRLVMAVAAGDVFRAETMPEQEASVARRFRDEGYIDPRVTITWERRADGHYHLSVDIRKGPHYIMDEVRLNGNLGIGDASLKARMSTWRRSVFGFGKMRFTDRLLQDDVRRLVELYRERGFADVVIEAETVASGPDNRHIACVLHIQEGPRYRIEFSGNQAVSNRRLRRELVLFESGNRGNIGLRRAANQMRRLYQEAGFPDAQVRWRENAGSSDPEAVREIVFDIEEGQRHIVRRIEIAGNAHIGEQAVRRQMLTRPPGIFHKGVYESELLREDVAAVETLYLNEGFLDIRVNESVEVDPQTADVQINIQIDEGPRTRVAQVAIEGDSPVPEESLRQDLRLKPDAPYTDFALDEDKNTLSARISPRGYPHVDVRSEALMSSDRTRADVRHTITPGPHVLVGDTFFFGNFKTREKFMRRELGIEAGENFALGSILEGQRRLRDLGIFESVQVHTIGLREKEDTVHLLVRTLEQEPYFFLAGLGYQTDRGFYGRAGIGDRNFSGTAKDVWLSGEISQVGYRVDLGIAEPRLLGSVIRAESAVFIERSEPLNQDFGTRTRGARLSFSRAWRETWSAGLGLRYERREQFVRDESVLETVDDPDAFEPRGIVVTTPSVLYDSRDSFIRPSRGQLASVAVDVSKGLDNTLDDFLKYRFEARTYHALGQRVVLAGRFWGGYVDPYGTDEVPLDQLFYLGGAATVRGFAENTLRTDDTGSPSGGRLALAAGLETRIEIGSNFELTPFVDAGSVRLSPTELGSDSLRWSAGLGFQYITPIGPIGLFYGHKLDRREGEGAGRWHISVGYTF
jgi:outer membrane protein insertion porin family